jgi:hypothetical protein
MVVAALADGIQRRVWRASIELVDLLVQATEQELVVCSAAFGHRSRRGDNGLTSRAVAVENRRWIAIVAFWLARGSDTSRYPDGDYLLSVEAGDVRGNVRTAPLELTLEN